MNHVKIIDAIYDSAEKNKGFHIVLKKLCVGSEEKQIFLAILEYVMLDPSAFILITFRNKETDFYHDNLIDFINCN